MPPDLKPLVRRIRELHGTGKPWGLGAGEVARLLGVEEMEMIRRVYTAGLDRPSGVDIGMATATFGPGEGPELVSFAELLGAADAERVLCRVGLHLPHAERVELIRTFLEHAGRRVGSHVPDRKILEGMLRTLGSVEAAERVYLGELPDLATLRDEAASIWCAGRAFEMPGLARRTALGILELYFTRKVLTPDQVYGALREEIRRVAAALGYRAKAERRERAAEEAPSEPQDAVRAARRCMGLEGRRLTPQVLRAQYRTLMKRYHPDVNPTGLERCQQINAAYAVLTGCLTGPLD